MIEGTQKKIYSEIRKTWARCYQDLWGRQRPTREFIHTIARLERENRNIAKDGLQPWLAIFELGIEWLTYVHIALANKQGGPEKHTRPYWALIGASVSFGLSIRTTCLSGFDTPARSLLRSYVEALFLCLAALDDPGLAAAYTKAEEDQDVRNFWHKEASPRRLHQRIIDLEKRNGFPDEVSAEFSEWRRGEYDVLSQASHLSYAAACLTAMTPSLKHEDAVGIAFLGLASAASHRTLFYAATTTWYFSGLAYKYLGGYGERAGLFKMDEELEIFRRIVAGREALAHLVHRYWTDGKGMAGQA